MLNRQNYLGLFLLLFSLIFVSELQAQWKLSVKNKFEDPFNAFLFLEYSAPTDRDKNFLVEVRFRLKDTRHTYLKKEFTLATNRSQIFAIGLKLLEGDYEVDAFIHDTDLDNFASLKLDKPFSVNSVKPIRVSDIFLKYDGNSKDPFSSPILDKILDTDNQKLYYFMELKAPDYEALTVRAVLYKKDQSNLASRTEAYSSVTQTQRILYVNKDTSMIFKDSLRLNALTEGEYLLDVRIYDDGLPLKTEDIRFEVGGDIKRKIFSDLNNSIRMMEYTMPIEELDRVLRIPIESEVKEDEFIELWEKLYGEDYEEEMEAYYHKVFEANDRYSDVDEGWRTDRGKIFIQYGEPKTKDLTIKGKDYQKWIYGKWSLVFLFEKRNKRYLLVE